MQNRQKSISTNVIVMILLLAVVWGSAAAEATDTADFNLPSYAEYRTLHSPVPSPSVSVYVGAVTYTAAHGSVETVPELAGRGPALITGEEGWVEWLVTVPQTGWYNLDVTYYPVEGRRSTIERELLIDGQRPFEEAGYLNFHRIWADAGPVRTDNQGNEIRPPQHETPAWRCITVRDSMGTYSEPFVFYLTAGEHRLRLVSRREPMAIHSLSLVPAQPLPAYATVLSDYTDRGIAPTDNVFVKVQGQDSVYRSSPTLFAVTDRGDPTVEPYDPVLLRLNTVGGQRWDQPGDWIAWSVTVPESGLYKIGIKGKQNIRRGVYSSRELRINGRVPFAEARALRFPFSSRYDMHVLGDAEQGKPYLFYLEAGTHIIEMEVVLGDMASVIRRTQELLYEMNTVYRHIVMITSANPDPLRDYQLERRMPNLVSRLQHIAGEMTLLADELEGFTGQRGEHVAVLRDLARQFATMAERPQRIPRRLAEFRDHAGALGTWILHTREQPLQIDYLVVASPNYPMPATQPTVAQLLGHEARAFIASFTYDYSRVGDMHAAVSGGREPLTVWIGAGRDQAQALKEMIEDDFTPATGIPVNLELVQMGILLPATLAGRGPDVALGVNPSQPINFALRGAAVDLTQFADYGDVLGRFRDSAVTPFRFRDSVYALPEQQPFPMLFYRRDILAELGLPVPQTWDDVYYVIAELQKEHMEFGFPFSSIDQGATGNIGEGTGAAGSLSAHAGVMTFLLFLYQMGEDLFLDDGIATNLDSEAAIDAFARWTELYELYNLPLQFDVANRFRMGEMPLVITGYTLYNTLQVFAPELRGQWDFTLIPGTPRPDGSLDRTTPAGMANAGGVPGLTLSPTAGPGSMILSQAKDKEAAWEFLKWWTSAETQVRFGRELESLMGAAARYPTANVEALRQLPWSLEEHALLEEQWQWVRGVPEVPGGYMTGRHLDNAFRRVVYHHEPARETLLDYNRVINEEISLKRREFGLETLSLW